MQKEIHCSMFYNYETSAVKEANSKETAGKEKRAKERQQKSQQRGEKGEKICKILFLEDIQLIKLKTLPKIKLPICQAY